MTLFVVAGKKANGVRGGGHTLAGSPPQQRKSRLHAFGRLFKPWKWKRKKKSEKFEAASKSENLYLTPGGFLQISDLQMCSRVVWDDINNNKVPSTKIVHWLG